MERLCDLEIETLVNRYAEATAEHGRATERGDHRRANRAQEVVSSVYRELRRRGLESQRLLLRFLTDSNAGTRLWAASHSLEFSPGDGEPVLIAMSETPQSLVGFSAKMTLKQWREGKLRFL